MKSLWCHVTVIAICFRNFPIGQPPLLPPMPGGRPPAPLSVELPIRALPRRGIIPYLSFRVRLLPHGTTCPGFNR